MSLLAIAMDVFLAALMISALVLGVRLNSRLKALRHSHEGFARAIVELNDAAVRAEKGLAGLREAATETHDSLLARIETARSLSGKLETQIHTARALLESQERIRMPPPTGSAPDTEPPKTPPSMAPAPQPPESLRRLAERFGLTSTGEFSERRPRPDEINRPATIANRPQRPARRMAPGEDDLFEPIGGVDRTASPAAGPVVSRQPAPQTPAPRPHTPAMEEVERDEYGRPREPLTPEDFAARIRARKAAR